VGRGRSLRSGRKNDARNFRSAALILFERG